MYVCMQACMYKIFILHVSGILECLAFFLLKHYSPLGLAFPSFTTDAYSVLSKTLVFNLIQHHPSTFM
jgi:hypothetical protein